MRFLLKAVTLCLGLLSAGLTPVSAQEPGLILHLMNQCRADAVDLCGDIAPGGGRVAVCLYAHMDELRPRCQQAMRVGIAIKACGFDASRLCRGVEPGGGRVAACLSDSRDELSPTCLAVLTPGDERWSDQDEREFLK